MKAIFWGQPVQTSVVRKGDWIVSGKLSGPRPLTYFNPVLHVGSATGGAGAASIGHHAGGVWNSPGAYDPGKEPVAGFNVNNGSDVLQLYFVGATKPHGEAVLMGAPGYGVPDILLTWTDVNDRYVSDGGTDGQLWWQMMSDNFNLDVPLTLQEYQ